MDTGRIPLRVTNSMEANVGNTKTPTHKKKQLSFQNFWVYGAMEMTEVKSEFAYMPYTSKAITQIFMEQISHSEPEAQHIVVWDGAGFHQNEEKPDNIYLIKLPAYRQVFE